MASWHVSNRLQGLPLVSESDASRRASLLWLDSTTELYEWKQIEARRAGDGGRLAHDRSDAGALGQSGEMWWYTTSSLFLITAAPLECTCGRQ